MVEFKGTALVSKSSDQRRDVARVLADLGGIPFFKMTGSGNDFVFFDSRKIDASLINVPEVIQAICNRHNGIGADGVVIIKLPSKTDSNVRNDSRADADVLIDYRNSDGTPADLCGNATLCSAALAVTLGIAGAEGVSLGTPSGLIRGRMRDEQPEIDLQPVSDVRSEIAIEPAGNEQRIGFAMAAIPHLVVLCEDADEIDVARRGPELRHHSQLGAAGANVNWVSRRSGERGGWRYRTYERGVEGETLACGTGAVATAILLNSWTDGAKILDLETSSGKVLEVRVTRTPDDHAWLPSLRGEGRIVFRGVIGS